MTPPASATPLKQNDHVAMALQAEAAAQARYDAVGAEANRLSQELKDRAKAGDPEAKKQLETAQAERERAQQALIAAQSRLARVTGGQDPHAKQVKPRTPSTKQPSSPNAQRTAATEKQDDTPRPAAAAGRPVGAFIREVRVLKTLEPLTPFHGEKALDQMAIDRILRSLTGEASKNNAEHLQTFGGVELFLSPNEKQYVPKK